DASLEDMGFDKIAKRYNEAVPGQCSRCTCSQPARDPASVDDSPAAERLNSGRVIQFLHLLDDGQCLGHRLYPSQRSQAQPLPHGTQRAGGAVAELVRQMPDLILEYVGEPLEEDQR